MEEAAPVPTPYINVDQHQSEDATIVEIKFGDRLGALLDTVRSECSPSVAQQGYHNKGQSPTVMLLVEHWHVARF